MSKRTIIQPGTSDPADLFLYVHIDPAYVRDEAGHATRDAVVTELWGPTTSAYGSLLDAYGGFRAWVQSIETKLSKRFVRTCLTTWSAGSQVAKDVCRRAQLWDARDVPVGFDHALLPDAIVMLDGLYAPKPVGSKPGDGKVIFDPGLGAIAHYACLAAKGEKILVILHSRIPTAYGSSAECAAELRRYVEGHVGEPFETIEADDLGPFESAVRLRNLIVIGFPGTGAAEHVREAHLFDEVWQRFIPWTSDPCDNEKTDPERDSIAGRALTRSIRLAAMRVGERPPGSNKVDPAYWAGVTRIIGGREVLLKVGNPAWAWCAAAFQAQSYEAAYELGYSTADIEDWRTGPIPHGRRISVLELQNDFKARGLFRTATEVRQGAFEPARGDAVFLDRGTDPAHGHVCRYIRRIDANLFETVGGNEAGTVPGDEADLWRVTVRRFDDSGLRGFGSFPAVQRSPASSPAPCTPIEVGDLSALAAALCDRRPVAG